MSQKQQTKNEGQNLPGHSEDNDVNLSIPEKKQRIVDKEKRGEEGMHCRQEIFTGGMDHKDFQIRQLNQKVATLESENMEINTQNAQMHEKINQLQNEVKEKDEVID